MKNNKQNFLNKFSAYCNNKLEVVSEYVNRRTNVMVKCVDCQYVFSFKPVNVYGGSKFKGCSNCFLKNNFEEYSCLQCGKKIYRNKNTVSMSGNVFCSRSCGNAYKSRKRINLINSAEYRRNAFMIYPHKCAICGYDDEEDILEVHHIDENRKNNDISNLNILCPICHKKLTLKLYKLSSDRKHLIKL